MTDPRAEVEARERLVRDFASAFVRIRGTHNPNPGEPCALCWLAAEQAAEAVVTTGLLARPALPSEGGTYESPDLFTAMGLLHPNEEHHADSSSRCSVCRNAALPPADPSADR